jgi:L-lactate dehydrogenase complex protein LldG
MNAREKILAKVRKAQNPASAATSQALTSHLTLHPRGPLPPQPDNLIAYFKARALKLSSDVLETNDIGEVPTLLARYLAERKLPERGVCWPLLKALRWSTAGLEIQSCPARAQARSPLLNPLPQAGEEANGSLREFDDDDMVGITSAFCGIAETGTLMMLSGADTPATTSLLPETHIAILDPKRIVACMEDAWDLMRKEHNQPPRAVNFISGPSRTADIEQTVTLGAHGPYRVLIILAPIDA